MIKVSAYSPQRYNNQQLKRQNSTSFGIKVIQPQETIKGISYSDLIPVKAKDSWAGLVSPKPPTGDDSPFYLAEKAAKIADGKDSPFHML